MDEIRIDNLQVYACHGVFPEENRLGQTFYLNAVLYMDTRAAGCADDLEQSVDYGQVCHLMTGWMKEHTCKLIEAAAEGLAREILLRFSRIKAVRLELRKPQAPIGLPVESVSVRIKRGWHRVYLAIGSNLGDRRKYLEEGIAALRAHSDIRVKRVSSIIATQPYGGVEQGEFLNGCLLIETLLKPGELLGVLHETEQVAGRERKIHWGPRTLDLDIIFYDDLVYEDEELVIPHVDMHNRSFVLEPMKELAPNLRHPVLGKTMTQLLEELKDRA